MREIKKEKDGFAEAPRLFGRAQAWEQITARLGEAV